MHHADKLQRASPEASPEARARFETKVAETLRSMPLAEIRSVQELPQASLAEEPHVEQAATPPAERRRS